MVNETDRFITSLGRCMESVNNLSIRDFSKLIYFEIARICLEKEKGYCNATNSYFEKLFIKSTAVVSSSINELKANGLIKIDNALSQKRTIYLLDTNPLSERKALQDYEDVLCKLIGYDIEEYLLSILQKLSNYQNLRLCNLTKAFRIIIRVMFSENRSVIYEHIENNSLFEFLCRIIDKNLFEIQKNWSVKRYNIDEQVKNELVPYFKKALLYCLFPELRINSDKKYVIEQKLCDILRVDNLDKHIEVAINNIIKPANNINIQDFNNVICDTFYDEDDSYKFYIQDFIVKNGLEEILKMRLFSNNSDTKESSNKVFKTTHDDVGELKHTLKIALIRLFFSNNEDYIYNDIPTEIKSEINEQRFCSYDEIKQGFEGSVIYQTQGKLVNIRTSADKYSPDKKYANLEFRNENGERLRARANSNIYMKLEDFLLGMVGETVTIQGVISYNKHYNENILVNVKGKEFIIK